MRERAYPSPAPRWRAAVATVTAVGAMALFAACSGSTDTPAAATPATTPAASAVTAAAATTPFPTRYFDDQVDLIYTPPGGSPTHTMTGPPAPGGRMELVENLYPGDHATHSGQLAGTNHTTCEFGADLNTHCTSRAIFGDSTLTSSSTGSESDFDSAITGGTGRFAGATGSIHVHTLGDTNDADITINLG
ncbi:hypothetical protein [Frankia gtarii]|uniref:hypothetical protein n=1 Tax=Frankia gtarii TaxID=2950102 RepID=UPI0021C0542D|nr:hypothetical protein [Frankia gtarii]